MQIDKYVLRTKVSAVQIDKEKLEQAKNNQRMGIGGDISEEDVTTVHLCDFSIDIRSIDSMYSTQVKIEGGKEVQGAVISNQASDYFIVADYPVLEKEWSRIVNQME